MFDTLIIGAGAAGIAAARKLHDAGEKVAILEARDRIGGRIYTDFNFAPAFPIEWGAEFIHGETTVTLQLVTDAGLHTIATPRYETLRWRSPAGGDDLLPENQLPEPLRTTLFNLQNAYNSLVREFHPPPDISLADYLRRQGFDEDAIRLADVRLAQTCCASIETLGCADLQREMQMDHAGGLQEFKIKEGYLPLLQWYSRGLDIRLNTRVHTIRWRGANNGVQVSADPQGDDIGTPQSAVRTTPHSQFSARKCIITLPVGVLQSRKIEFDPPLSAAKQVAIQSLRMEPATKLLYRFDRQLWNDDLLYFCHAGLAARWWIPGFGQRCTEESNTVACAFATADRARQIDELSEAEALAIGLDELGQLLGRTDLADHLVAARRHSWASDPMALGGYAHVPPGAADARVELARPEDNALFFAGEATAYDTNPQTVHGAIESGWRAARACSVTVGPQVGGGTVKPDVARSPNHPCDTIQKTIIPM
jgi:monoamine oxidase